MNTLYLICGSDKINQEKLAYLLNNSPELCGEQTIQTCDEYAALPDQDFEWYNPEIKELSEINDQQLDQLLNIIEDKSAAVVLDAQNMFDMFNWSRGTHVILINAVPDGENYGHEVDRLIEQKYWSSPEYIHELWSNVGIQAPSESWIADYISA
jgi:hypothetical protein